MEEVWRDIPGYEGRYQVSNLGQVKSLPHRVQRRNVLTGGMSNALIPEKILKPQVQKSGHLEVKLGTHHPKHHRIHRLVMLAFCGPCPPGMEVCHNDSNPANNQLGNLRYDTRLSNRLDMVRVGNEGRQVLKVPQVYEIRARLEHGDTCIAIAEDYGVDKSTISKIKQGRSFAWLK